MLSRRKFLAALAAAGAGLAGRAPGAEGPRKPNFILIIADDLGYGELGCYGQKKIRTPRLDQLAAEGLRFTQGYSGAAVCAPSRFTLMTGRHIGRAATYGQGQKLRPDAPIIPKVLKQAGYATAAFGKWGLGPDGPARQGFDEWYGFVDQSDAHFFYPDKIQSGLETIDVPENRGLRADGRYGDLSNGVYIHDRFTERALRFIEEKRAQPFFLYMPYTIPHLELVVPADSLAEYAGQWPERSFDTTAQEKPAGGTAFYDGRGYCSVDQARATYAAMVSRLDRDIGRIIDHLRQLGLDRDTLVLFSSDNGPSRFEAGGYDREFFEGAGPLRDGKGSFYEGGIRVPWLAWWPGRIAPGGVSDLPCYFPDVMPTLSELAGAQAPEKIDGISLVPTLLGVGEQRRHEFLFWEKAVRLGDWKYVNGQLFNLADDIGETRDVAAQNPDVVRRIKEIIEVNRIPAAQSKNKVKDTAPSGKKAVVK